MKKSRTKEYKSSYATLHFHKKINITIELNIIVNITIDYRIGVLKQFLMSSMIQMAWNLNVIRRLVHNILWQILTTSLSPNIVDQ